MKKSLIVTVFILLLSCSAAFATLPFTLTKYVGNPVLAPTGVAGNNDSRATRDASFIVTGSTYNIVYTGGNDYSAGPPYPDHSWESMLATSSSPFGPYTRRGTLFSSITPPGTIQATGGDPFLLYDGTTWHAWISVIPSGLVNQDSSRQISHLTASGSAGSIPISGWSYENAAAVVGLTTGWTSVSPGVIAGVAGPKVFPKDGGGWIMYLCGWGYSAATEYQVGYATASSLNGPWVLSSSALFGTPGGYQAEQIVYFKSGSKHYLVCNRLGLYGRGGASWPDLHIDLWESTSQTGPFTLAKYDFIPRGSGWDAGAMGVTGIGGSNLDTTGMLYGVYDSTSVSGAPLARSIGVFTITSDSFSPPASARVSGFGNIPKISGAGNLSKITGLQ